MKALNLFAAAAVVTGLTGAAWGQEIQERRENQQDRIAQGVASGQLTAGETAHLEGNEALLNGEIRADRQANGGALTPQERAQVNQQQNGLSNQIYADKHNAYVRPTPRSEVGARAQYQQERIAQGIASGQLTAGETARLETKEAGLNGEVRA